MPDQSPPEGGWTAYLAFASFGFFWGTWGASLPAIKARADLTDGQLGSALLLVGLGALPSMALSGRLMDRYGARVAAACLALLSSSNIAVALGAKGPDSVALCMLLVGATSGAADVAINTLAGDAERKSCRPVLSLAHGAFSATVVLSSLLVGALGALNVTMSASLFVAFVAGLVPSVLVWVHAPDRRPRQPVVSATTLAGTRASNHMALRGWLPYVTLGLVGALAYATENAHQSWGAVLVTDVLSSPELGAVAPAIFAGAAAVTRLGLARLSRSHPRLLLTAGGAVAALGTVLLATASTVLMAFSGLAVASVGTSMLFPTLLSYGLHTVAPGARGRVTSTVSTTAYLGYLIGPAFVGLVANRADLRIAFLGVAGVIVTFTLTSTVVGGWAHRAWSSQPVVRHGSTSPCDVALGQRGAGATGTRTD